MEFRETIKEAWEIAQSEKRLMYTYAFLPALISTVAGTVFIGYQAISLKKYFDHERSLIWDVSEMVLNFLQSHPSFWAIFIVGVVFLAVLYLLYPSFCEGAMIQLIARKYNKQEVNMLQGLTFGAKTFFPILEFNGLLSFFGLSALIGYSTLILRTLGPEVLQYAAIFFAFVGILSLVMTFLFTYAQYYIAIDHDGVFSAIGKSTNLVVAHWQSTFLMVLLLLLIGLRILVNILLILVIPGLILLLAGFFASITLNFLGNIIAIIIAITGIFVAGYLGGVLSVFAHAVWTLTFLKLTKDGELSARAEV